MRDRGQEAVFVLVELLHVLEANFFGNVIHDHEIGILILPAAG